MSNRLRRKSRPLILLAGLVALSAWAQAFTVVDGEPCMPALPGDAGDACSSFLQRIEVVPPPYVLPPAPDTGPGGTHVDGGAFPAAPTATALPDPAGLALAGGALLLAGLVRRRSA